MHEHASLNRAYRVVFNAALGAMVAVPETARSHGGRAARTVAASAGLVLALAGPGAWAQTQTVAPNALPQGGKVAAGQATINDPAGNHLRIDQASDRAIVNWSSFDIGRDASVHFAQPSASMVILNRVQSGPGSQILGALQADQQVYLVNSAGILFGKDAQVNVGGITASTLDIRNDDFLNGRDRFSSNGGTGSVVNQGTINVAPGGRVALIGTRVENAGQILAPGGQVVLAAGQKATLAIGANGHLQVAVDAAQVGTLVANGGLIQADGGQVILTAKGAGALTSSVVSNTGTLQAHTVAGSSGRILLLADMDNGKVEAGGTLDASAPHGGNGGFVETSAAHVKIAPDVHVTTLAPQGQTGTWLIDPQDYNISASGGDMTGAQLSASLATTSMVIQSSSGGTAGNGDINVNDAVSWNANTLTLTAARDININAVMTASGTSALALNTGTGNGGDPGVPAGTVKVALGLTGFRGRVDFPGRSGTGFLTINGAGYTVINSLGTAGSMTGADLQGMNGDLGRNYALGGDIDASATSTWNGGEGFMPVGPGTTYTGNFEGLGHVVQGLAINRPNQDAVGLFGWTSGRVSNVGQVGGSVTGRRQTGGLVGQNFGEIFNSHATGVVQGGAAFYDEVGGLVGRNEGSIRASRSSVAVTAVNRPRVGGLAGRNNGSIADSYATGSVTGTHELGGLVGNNAGSITGSYATGSVAGTWDVGGLVGLGVSGSGIADSFATGSVNADTGAAGGLVGSNSGSVLRSHATGEVHAQGNAGGLVGYGLYYGTNVIDESYATGAVTAVAGHAGGLAGLTDIPISRSYATGAVAAPNGAAGGLVGYSQRSIDTSYATGPVSGGTHAGGLVGYGDGGASISNSYWNVETTGQATSWTGGTGLTSAQMQVAANFVGFNFTTTPGAAGNNWVMVDVDGTLNNAGGAAGATRPMLASEYSTTIRNAHQLQLMTMDLGAEYRLGRNVDAAATGTSNDVWTAGGFIPVGSVTPFSGTLDGGNRTISGLVIDRPGDASVGLFAVNAGTVRDLGLVGGSVGGALGGSFFQVGALAGINDGTITNVSSTTAVTGDYNVGGLVGLARAGSITGSRTSAEVHGTFTVGGLVGKNQATIERSYATGNVTATFSEAGGLVGYNDLGTINNSYYAGGTVTGPGSVGGLVGFNDGTIYRSHATGAVNGAFDAGGLVGSNCDCGVIDQSYAAASVQGTYNTGGLVGSNMGLIRDSYAVGSVLGADATGGLVGFANDGGTITRSYSAASVTGGTSVGGLVGFRLDLGANTIENSFWDMTASGQSGSDGGTGLTSAQMKQLATFAGASWDISATGGTGNIWRIYEGDTAPLLRGQLMPLAVIPVYDGSGTPLANAGAYSLPAGADPSKIFGATSNNALTLSSSGTAGHYLASVSTAGLYSSQSGYDIASATRTIATPGSAAGNVRLDNPITWTNGTVDIAAANNVDLNGQGLSSANGRLNFNAGNQVQNAGNVAVNLFDLQAGTWDQVAGTLPSFSATDFRISGGTFVRAAGGDGSAPAPYQLTDVYGLQGVGSSGMADMRYVLANDIAAAGTVNWNAGDGFAPIFLSNLGRLDGQGHAIDGIVIHRPGELNVGLVDINFGTVANLRLVGGSVLGGAQVGAVAGVNGGTIDNVTSTTAVTGTTAVGGLVGSNAGEIADSFASGNVHAPTVAGGLVGYNIGVIGGSHASGTVTGDGRAGGLVGLNDADGVLGVAGVIGGSFATGAVSVTSSSAGGLVGENLGAIEDSYATGAATGFSDIGGLVGRNPGAITRSYATGTADGTQHTVGGLVGHHSGTISNSYATGAATGGSANVGGLVGYAADGSSVENAYASGAVTAPGWLGGLVGGRQSVAGTTITASYWNSDTAGPFVPSDGMERTTAQMQSLATFSGWDISATGGTSNVWRIYEGSTAPLLRGFLTPLAVTPVYDGSGTPLANASAYTVPGGADASRIFSTPDSALVLSSSGATGNYFAGITGLYSNQSGYDLLPSGRTIATPGSAAGTVRLDSPITWTSGTVDITAASNIDLNGRALTSTNGRLNLDAGNQILNMGSVAVNLFDLQGGTWEQVGAALPSFSAFDFRLSGGTFIRALSGDGSAATPYRLTDVYGLQGIASAGMGDKDYVLANDVAAAGTATWNAGAGFAPIVLDTDGSFDGQGHTIAGLWIHRPGEGGVGLFSSSQGTVVNVGLVGGEVTGGSDVGAIAGWSGGLLGNVYSTATVTGANWVGGLVGTNAGQVQDSHATGEVNGSGGQVGGLAGSNFGSIARSHATGKVTAIQSQAGGLAGENDGTIEDSYATGDVLAGEYAAGGLVGRHLGGSIARSYATGRAEATFQRAGGLVGHLFGAISDSYATGEVTGGDLVGGLVGYAGDGSSVTNSYATGAVGGTGALGGLVGARQSAAATVTSSYWDTTTTGQSASDGGTGVDTATMRQLATFAGWDISASGGTGNVWRIYEGNTAPLLRGFLTPLTVTPAYDGSGTPLANATDYTVPGGTDTSLILGTADRTLTLSSSGAAGNYLAGISGLYSSQSGYDIVAERSIATPGSAAGDVRIDNPITWTSGTINVTAANNVDLNSQALASTNGTLNFNAGNRIVNAGNVAVNLFDLQGGTWDQVAATLPSFSATDFRLSGGTFIRAQGGDGTTATPYQLADIYGLQGVNGTGMEDRHYLLVNDIAAAGTAGWNAGAGFAPIFLSNFGRLDGQGHAINGLVINRPGEDLVGLFTANAGEVSNLRLVGGSVTGRDGVGAVVGFNAGKVTNVHSTAAVTGEYSVGGLVGLAGPYDSTLDVGSNITGSHAEGSVQGIGEVGGLVGTNAGAIANSHATGAVTATESAGGLVGYNEVDATITTSHASGNVQAQSGVGGLVGDNAGVISLSYAAGGTVTGDVDVGGLVGAHCDCGSISQSYAVADVHGNVQHAGGLVGYSAGPIGNSYATGAVAGQNYVGGLVGFAESGASISNSYSGATSVTGSTAVGGLVGFRADPGTTPVDNSFWTLNAGVPIVSDGGDARTGAEMMQLATFAGAGWDISATGGTGDVWRIYEGQTAPLLRGLLTPLVVMPAYDGSGTPLANATDYTVPGGTDTSLILGTVDRTLRLSSSGVAGNYLAGISGLYSSQSGYDIVAERSIATPGSAAGDVRLDNPVTWTSGTINVTAANNVDLNSQALASTNGTLNFDAGNRIVNAGNVAVNLFDLQGGTWDQVAGTLPSFSATDFRLSGGTFIRARGGDGTTATPYQLADVYGLQGIGSAGMMGNSYVLADDVDATGTAAWNAGAGFAPVAIFTGSFDGLGNTIAGLTINRPSQIEYVGLFGQATGPLSNVGLVGGSVVGARYVGGLAGMSWGPISNAYNTGTVSGIDSVGGLVGYVGPGGTVTGSHATGAVGGVGVARFIGGLVGYLGEGSSISGSHATGAVNGGLNGGGVGGLAGGSAGNIDGSHATGPVTGAAGLGGLVGMNQATTPGFGNITNSHATGAVTGRSLLGGLVGYNEGAISDSYATGDVTGTGGGGGSLACPVLGGHSCTGGLVGNSYGTISGSYATGDVSAVGRDVGGLVGRTSSGMSSVGIVDSYATGDVSSSGSRVGGLVGFSELAIQGSHHTTGRVTGSGVVGGLVGESRADISDSYATGEVVSGLAAGGLVGSQLGGTISRSFADVAVTGGTIVGGLVGEAQVGSIEDSYATGSVTATGYNGFSSSGGLVGELGGASITRSYATGAVADTGPDDGGLVGVMHPSGSVSDSYWDVTTTGQGASAAGTGRTTAQMRQLSTFGGWDISATGGTGDVWRIYEGNTAPLLRGFLTPLAVTPAYDGSGTPLANAGDYSVPGGTDTSRIFGTASNTLTLASSGTAGNYLASVPLDGLYSNQFGYDMLPATRTIATPGSAMGDVRLDNPITWSNGTVNVTAVNNVDLNNQALNSTSGTLNFNAGNRIVNGGNVAVDLFQLQGGTWDQVAGTLPSFSATDFRIGGGTFIRALGGDGTTTTPYQLTDVYGLQGVGSTGMGSRHYVLANDIAAAGTLDWNANAGFVPLASFGGSLDGQGYAIDRLFIDRPGAFTPVGLFSVLNNTASVSNLEISGGSVHGNSEVGALAGRSSGSILNVSSSAEVQGDFAVGGLVGLVMAGSITDSRATGTVDGGNSVGGLVGTLASGATIDRSHATGDVTATQSAAGGLVGGNGGVVTGSYATGTVRAQFAAGGLVGDLFLGSIAGSYATGAVLAEDGAGGLVGLHEGTVSDSYATGAVVGTGPNSFRTGGLAGWAANGGSTTNSYASGQVTGTNSVGGLIGERQSAAATVTNSFWNTETSGQSTSDGGIGRTTAQMQAQATFTGWDFSGTWVQYEGHTSPLLRSFMTPLTVTANNATKTYDGQAYDGSAGVSYSFAPDMGLLLGSPTYTSGVNAGTHAITPGGHYSHQQGYLITFVDGTLTVDRKELTLTDLVADGRQYDRTDVAGLRGGILHGLVGSETLGFSASGTFDNPNAGTGKPVTVTAVNLSDGSGLASNYTVILPATSLSANIDPRPLNVTVSGVDKVYDGNASAGLSYVDDRLAGDTITYSTTFAEFDNKNAGTAKPITVLGIASGNPNYVVVDPVQATSANITARDLNVTAFANSKTYDGRNDATGFFTDDRVGPDLLADHLTYAGTFRFDNKNAGNGKLVNLSNFVLGGSDAGNYRLVGTPANPTANILRANLRVFVGAIDREYDGTANADVFVTGDTSIPSDDVGVSAGPASFADKNVGMGKQVTVSSLTLTGADAGNYTVTPASYLTTATISPRRLLVTATIVNKTYDRTTTATVNSLADDRVSGDVLDVTVTGANFDSPDAGVGRSVALTGTAATGADAGNYLLIPVPASANIDPRPLNLIVTGQDKVYDRSDRATVTYSDDRLGPDQIGFASTARFDNWNAGTGKPIAVTGLVITGPQAGNYSLASSTASTSADITPATLHVSTYGVDKTYDGTTAATVSFQDGRIPGDVLTVVSDPVAFADRHAGNGKPLSVTGISLTGPDAGNYRVDSATASTTASIFPRGLFVYANGIDKVYDGTTAAGANLFDNRIAGDLFDVTGNASFDNKNVGIDKGVTVSGITFSGPHAGNYIVPTAPLTTRADITPRPLDVSATAADKVYDRSTAATVSLSDNRVAGDQLTVNATGAFRDWNAGNGKTVDVTGVTLGADAGNYAMSVNATTTASITPAPLVVAVDSQVRTADGEAFAGAGTLRYLGLVAGDDASVLFGLPIWSGTAQGASLPGRYSLSVAGSGFSSANYSISYADGTLTIVPGDNRREAGEIERLARQDVEPAAAAPAPARLRLTIAPDFLRVD